MPCSELPRLPVSVIVPAYNRAGTLPRCLASIQAQRPALPAEVIVVDDGSTDDTAAAAAAHGATVIRHDQNRGFAAFARNTGLEAASYEWAAFLDSDDEWLPDHLDHLWRLRDDHALVGSSSLRCGPDPRKDRFHGPASRGPLVLRSPDRLIATYNLFTASGSMVRRDAALELGGFHPRWGVEDLDFWVRLLERHTAICSPRVTVIYHIHDDNLSSHGRRMLEEHRAAAQAHRKRTAGSLVPVQRWDGVLAWDSMRAALVAGDRREALRSGLAILRGRQRAVGVALLLGQRFLERRASARVSRDGGPSLALLVRDPGERATVTRAARGRTVRDLSAVPRVSAGLELLRRPAGIVVVDSRRRAALLRALGMPAVAARTLLENGSLPGSNAT